MRTVRGKSEKGDPSGPASAAGALRQQRGADRPELGLDRLDPCGHVRNVPSPGIHLQRPAEVAEDRRPDVRGVRIQRMRRPDDCGDIARSAGSL